MDLTTTNITNVFNGLKIPLAIILVIKLLDINILIFATILIMIGMFIDFLIYLNSSPVPLPYEREHFVRSAIKATVSWIGWTIVYWLLFSTLCAIGVYVGLPHFQLTAHIAGITLLTSIVLHDLRKLKYTKFYYFKPIKKFVDRIYVLLEDTTNQDQQPKNV